MDAQSCGIFIAGLRKEQGWTQKELAERLCVTDKAISRWETGKGLPDTETLLRLSDLFGVTINELLCGERKATTQISEDTLVDVLHMADDEKEKHRRSKARLVFFIAVLFSLFVLLFIHDVTAGGGKTLSSVIATGQARRIAAHIEDGRYEMAASHIGFPGRNRRIAKQEWADGMHHLFDGTLEVMSFTVFSLEEEDQFIYGTAQLRVFDPTTAEGYTLHVNVAVQDGITFGAVNSTDNDAHSLVLAQCIEETLSTYHPG